MHVGVLAKDSGLGCRCAGCWPSPSPAPPPLLLPSLFIMMSSFRRLSAHVPQADIALDLLTGSETFASAASLLHPESASTTSAAVAALLADLGSPTSHTRGSPPTRLYGRECRRVSIGLVILRSSAHVVISCLRAVTAAQGTAVVLSIHRPSARLLSAVDCLLLLSRGTVLHHGSLASLDAALLSGSPTAPLRVLPRPAVNPMRAAASNVRSDS
ncbi:ABC transporter G family member 4-like [Miscanthus floridulus]|uniref:ABC transporter G family member 4-like n=1 Tax=Miscanthus floridulus TaxID=154761 RepID=UPI003457B27A